MDRITSMKQAEQPSAQQPSCAETPSGDHEGRTATPSGLQDIAAHETSIETGAREGMNEMQGGQDSSTAAKHKTETSSSEVNCQDSFDSDDQTDKPPGRSWKTTILRPWTARRWKTSLPRPWRTTLIRWGPLAGLFCILLAVFSMLVSLGILIGSSDAPIVNWSVPPSSILAVCTAVANQALRFAAFQGVAIAWWFNASRGSTLRKLHSEWRAGTTVLGALAAGRNMGFVGLACVFSTLVAIDGPFLQRATSVVLAPIVDEPVPLSVIMAPEVPTDFTGGWLDIGSGTFGQRWFGMFNSTLPTSTGETSNLLFAMDTTDFANEWSVPWYREDPLSGFVKGCRDVCRARIRAPALAITSCASRQVSTNYTAHVDWDATITSSRAPPLSHTAFLIDVSLLREQGTEKLNLITGYSDSQDCAGTLNYTACTLESAVGDYDVIVEGETISFDAIGTPTIVALANNTRVNAHMDNSTGAAYHLSTLAGIASLALVEWQSGVTYAPLAGTIQITLWGSVAYQRYVHYKKNEFCTQMKDPRKDVIKSLNTLMFYTGAAAVAVRDESYLRSHMDPGLEFNTTVDGYLQGHRNVYHTDLFWFLAAAIVEGLCITLILPTYIGWWRLGRPISFSPLEIAKAFEAPLLSDCNSNSSGWDIAKSVGDTEVQYGAIRDGGFPGPTKLAFADPSIVGSPQKDSQFNI